MRHRPRFEPLLVLVALLATARSLNGSEALLIQVTPSVARAPALLTVRVSVQAAAANRLLQVTAESPDFYRSSQIELDGTNNPPLNVFEFRNLPQGLYQVTGTLVDSNGRRARASQLAKVEPPFGR